MLEYARWKYVVALIVLLLSALYALPNLYPQDPSVQITANRGSQVDAAFQARVEALLKEAGVTPKSVEIEKGGNLLVRTLGPDAQTRAADALNAELGSGYVVALNRVRLPNETAVSRCAAGCAWPGRYPARRATARRRARHPGAG